MRRVSLFLRVVLPAVVLCQTVLAADEVPLTVESFCEIQKRLLILSEAEWTERVAVAEAWKKERLEVRANVDATRGRTASSREGETITRERMQARLEQVVARFRGARSTLMATFETSDTSLGRFGRSNKDAVDEFLRENPAVRSETDQLRARVDGLLQRFESLAPARVAGGELE